MKILEMTIEEKKEEILNLKMQVENLNSQIEELKSTNNQN